MNCWGGRRVNRYIIVSHIDHHFLQAMDKVKDKKKESFWEQNPEGANICRF